MRLVEAWWPLSQSVQVRRAFVGMPENKQKCPRSRGTLLQRYIIDGRVELVEMLLERSADTELQAWPSVYIYKYQQQSVNI